MAEVVIIFLALQATSSALLEHAGIISREYSVDRPLSARSLKSDGRNPAIPYLSRCASYFPITAARPSGSATLAHSMEWSLNPMTLGILCTNAMHNPL